MKDTIQDLLTRRSIRSYKKEQITEEEMNTVLECGLYAPTAMGKQSPRMVAVRDAALIKRLSAMNAAVMGSSNDPFYGAPAAIVVFAQKENPNSVQDASLVLGNLLNAAHALGLGSCWINRAKEMFEKEDGLALMKEWGLSEEYAGVGICILGYIEGDYPVPVPRKADYIIRV